MADDLCLHVKEQPERVCLVYEGAEEMEINPSDEEQMDKNVYLLPACRKYGRIWGICGLCP